MATTLTLNKEDIYQYTKNMLEAHSQNNELFNSELAATYQFYRDKLFYFVKEQDKHKLEEDLYVSIKSQIFNGYYMGLEILNSKETLIPNEWFTQQSRGMITKEIPELLKTATDNDIEGVITYKQLKSLISWLVVEYEGIYPTLLDLSFNTACLGVKWAMIDEVERRNLSTYEPQHKGFLSYLDDITFISPQHYLVNEITIENSEVWSIINSSYNNLDKIGEVTIIKLTENPESYYMNIGLKSNLTISEHQKIMDDIVTRFLVIHEMDRSQLIINGYSVEDYYLFDNGNND